MRVCVRFVKRKELERMESSWKDTWMERGSMLGSRQDPFMNVQKNMLQIGLVARMTVTRSNIGSPAILTWRNHQILNSRL